MIRHALSALALGCALVTCGCVSVSVPDVNQFPVPRPPQSSSANNSQPAAPKAETEPTQPNAGKNPGGPPPAQVISTLVQAFQGLGFPLPPPPSSASPGGAAPPVSPPSAPRGADKLRALTYPKSPPRPDDVAIIIGNGDYTRQGHDIPDARTAYADAESMHRYALDALGIREGNIIFLKDATGNQLGEVFGNERDHRGRLFNWVKPGKSRVFVYYIGHGAPANADGRAMLVPVDASAGQIALSATRSISSTRTLARSRWRASRWCWTPAFREQARPGR